jgi:small-conductance mechanosensitive channel
MLREFLQQILFTIGENPISLGSVISATLIGLSILLIYGITKRKIFRQLLENSEVEKKEVKTFYGYLRLFLLLLILLIVVNLLSINYSFFNSENINFNVGLVIGGLMIIQAARIVDWVISNLFVHTYYAKQDERGQEQENKPNELKMTRRVQWIIYLFTLFLLLRNFDLDVTLFHTEFQNNHFDFKLTNIISAILILLLARVIISLLTQLILVGVYQNRKIDIGAQIALNQLVSYVIYVIAGIVALNYLGFNMTLIWGGAAALLVGLGLGLQQTFNDLFSGILLLFERSITVGDVLRLENGKFGTVKKIGLRTTMLETLGNVSLIVPNSKIVTNQVYNLTHNNNKVRFEIAIGVAYGSDTSAVKKLLLQAVKNNPYILDYPAPFVRFVGFGDSSLDFEIYFFSRNLIVIEDIKSDIRFDIDKLFRENNIEIPYPQRVVWSKKEE